MNAFTPHDTRIGSEILLAGGQYFDLLNPESSRFGILDIAHGLAHLCRFTGHTSEFYSVAQHSVLVSLLLPDEMALAGLLHDAQEAFVGDVATPLKNMLPGYREIERRIECAVLDRFGLAHEHPPEIKRADLVMLATEKRDLMPNCGTHWKILDGIDPHPERIIPLPPDMARNLFMMRYYDLIAV